MTLIKLTNTDDHTNTTIINTEATPDVITENIKTVLDPNLYAFDGDLYDWDAQVLAEHITTGRWAKLTEDAQAMHITVTGAERGTVA